MNGQPTGTRMNGTAARPGGGATPCGGAVEQLRALLAADDVDAALDALRDGPEPEHRSLRTLHEALQKGCDRKKLVKNLQIMVDFRRFTPVWPPTPAAAS